MRNDKDNIIVKKTFDFALDVIDYSEQLRSLNKFEMCTQLFKSGTSIGANTWEAQNAESKADFIHKSKIAAKEGDETSFWMELCKASKHYPDPSQKMFNELEGIKLIISKIIGTSKRKKFSN